MIDALDMPGGYKDGWSSWNPNGVKHCDDGISSCEGLLEFYWTNGRPWQSRCLKCGAEEMDPK